jgi:phosphoenolpyruvate carboxylase
MSFCVTIKDRFDNNKYESEEVLKWIAQYCKSYVGLMTRAIYINGVEHFIPDYHELMFHFDDESDATLFGLRWS